MTTSEKKEYSRGDQDALALVPNRKAVLNNELLKTMKLKTIPTPFCCLFFPTGMPLLWFPLFPITFIITDIPFPYAHLESAHLNSPLSNRPQIPCPLLFFIGGTCNLCCPMRIINIKVYKRDLGLAELC